MAHEHDHDTDTYYLDQLCMIGIAGAFAGICVTLYFLNTGMLGIMLAPFLHPFVLASGIALLVIVLIRAAVLWKAVGDKPVLRSQPLHHHDHHHHDHDHHDHGHHHHDHGHGGHDHHHDEHVQSHQPHTHEHVHAGPALQHTGAAPMPVVAPAHNHDHDHDHGWAPWRYVVLLVPLMLYLLGLPSKALPLGDGGPVDITKEAVLYSSVVALGPAPLNQAVMACVATADMNTVDLVAPIYIDGKLSSIDALKPGMKVAGVLKIDKQLVGHKGVAKISASTSELQVSQEFTSLGVIEAVDAPQKTMTVKAMENGKEVEQIFDLEAPQWISFKDLESKAFTHRDREEYKGKKVQVIGKFVPMGGSDRWFTLARLRMQCCGADAVQLNVPVLCKEGIKGYNKEDWVRVTGRVDFRELPGRPGIFQTVLIVNRLANIVSTPPDPEPYVR
jgi:hypothetical protein